jgi:hypothetical protein
MRLIDLSTFKVMVAAATPYAMWFTNIDIALKVVASIGAVIYIWMKIFYLYQRRNK